MASALMVILATMGSMAASKKVSFLNAKASKDSCACLKWKETYAKGVNCGSNAEFYLASKQTSLSGQTLSRLKNALGAEFCTRFYETLDDNYCVNVNMGDDVGQWCYVDSSCSSLEGGAGAGHDGVSWKKCEHGQDKTLRDYSPEQLAELATTAKLDLGLLHKMSYPLYKGHLWKEVSAFWNVPLTAVGKKVVGVPGLDSAQKVQAYMAPRWGDGTITPELRQKMQEIKDSGKPYSFDTDNDNHPPHVIVEGEKVYLVLGKLYCVSGC